MKIKTTMREASLVVQWWRICLPMQETWVQSLIQEDPTCCGAMKPMRHNYWACAPEPRSWNYRNPCALEPALATGKPTTTSSLCTTREKRAQQQRPSIAKDKHMNNFFFFKFSSQPPEPNMIWLLVSSPGSSYFSLLCFSRSNLHSVP